MGGLGHRGLAFGGFRVQWERGLGFCGVGLTVSVAKQAAGYPGSFYKLSLNFSRDAT